MGSGETLPPSPWVALALALLIFSGALGVTMLLRDREARPLQAAPSTALPAAADAPGPRPPGLGPSAWAPAVDGRRGRTRSVW